MSTSPNLKDVEESRASHSYGMDGTPTIMVVDDEDDMRMLMRQLLHSDAYSVIEAATASEAETKVLANPPHLILMDLSMPGTDGLSAVWHIRKQPRMATVPIIIVSA